MKTTFLLVLSCFMISAVSAQKITGERYTVSGGLLGAVNISKFKVDGDNAPGIEYNSKAGFAGGLWLNLPVTKGFSIEPQLMYSLYKYQTDDPGTTTSLLLRDGKIGYISLPLLLKFNAGNAIAITAGPQVDFLAHLDDKDNSARAKDDFKKTSVSLTGGVELFPHGRVTVFGRYIHGLTDMDNRANHAAEVEYENRNFQLGLKFKLFGKKETKTYQAAEVTPVPVPDSDGDGIADDVDKCPNQPGTAKYNGCPVPDSDGDGINDELDKCPNQAGIAKYDGCPIPDSDGDGINDEEDKCPNQAGTAKYNGCPVPDKDNDGINDEEDKCPDVAGTAANNGCPEVPANVSKSLGMSAQNISFSSGTAKLTTKSGTSLNQVVTLMNEHPTMHIKVEAHTDNAGDDDANMKLSQDRADAVKAYLVSKGITEDRITAEGFGETMPIADNNTSSGRTKNRRVEIKVLY